MSLYVFIDNNESLPISLIPQIFIPSGVNCITFDHKLLNCKVKHDES